MVGQHRLVLAFMAACISDGADEFSDDDLDRWRGLRPDIGKQRLSDDPTFQKKDYQKHIEEDPECNQVPHWAGFRHQLLAASSDIHVDLAYQRTVEWGLENASRVDEQAKVCIMGLN